MLASYSALFVSSDRTANTITIIIQLSLVTDYIYINGSDRTVHNLYLNRLLESAGI